MPQRVELMELTTGCIAGLPFAVAHARGGRLVSFVATIDGDGLVETREEVLAAARRFVKEQAKKYSDGAAA